MRVFIVAMVVFLAGPAGLTPVAQAQASVRSAAGESGAKQVSPPERYALGNGLRVILAPDSVMAGVRVAVAYDVGHAHDPASYKGLAHLVEHLTFHGTRHLTEKLAASLLDDVGAAHNAFTADEHTVYHTSAPTRALEMVLYVESERMAFALDGIDEATLALEKRVVAQEREERANSLRIVLYEEARRALYDEDHPFSVSRDTTEHVNGAELSAVRWFMQHSYRPDNATLVIVGDFALEPTRGLIEKYFGSIVGAPVPRLEVERTAPRMCGVHHVEVGHPFLLGKQMGFMWQLPARPTIELRVQRELAVAVLEARLRDELVHGSFTASSVAVDIETYSTHEMIAVWVSLQEIGAWDTVQSTVTREARELATTLLSDAALRSARASLATQAAFLREDGMRRAIGLAQKQPVDGRRAAIEQIEATSLRDSVAGLAGAHLILRARPTKLDARPTVVLDDDERDCR